MKILAILLLFFLASCLGQWTFDNAFISNTGDATVSTKSQGKLVTVSTDKGFAWIVSDTVPVTFDTTATLVCVSSGSTTDLGMVQRVEGGYPASYSKESQIMPIVGKNFGSLFADGYVFYAPTIPTRAAYLDEGISPPIYAVGDTVHISQTYLTGSTTSTEILTTIGGQTTDSVTAGTLNYGFGFELLGCGTAIWCIQDASQYMSSPGDCDPGNAAPTCPVSTTCANPQDQTDCSTASTFLINDYSCLTQCPSGTQSFVVKTGVNVCGTCTSPCSSCSTTSTTCTSCIANYYLYQSTCDTSCPAGTVKDDSTMTCGCTSPCKKCDGTSITCTSCIANYYLYQSTCYASCPTGTVKDDSTMTCGCTSPCKKCDGTSITCTSCVANYYLYQNTCVSSCPSGYEADTSSGECKGFPITTATATSQGFAKWKLGLAIGLPVAGILGISVLLYIKLAAKAAMKKMTGKTFKQLPSHLSSPATETMKTQV